MDYTGNIGLRKPTYTESGDVADMNYNSEILDEEISKRGTTVNGHAADKNGNYQVNEVAFAQNLVADDAQQMSGEFLFRTTGGDASLSDGDATLVSILGRRTHTGVVKESLTLTVDAATREEGEEPITATIDRDTFVAYVGNSGTTTLTYTDAWSANPTLYGVTVTGTPVAGDLIQIVYVKGERGTITPATPSAFRSTGWNLYNNSLGYARVKKYSDSYGFLIGGTYTAVRFAATVSGTQSTITPVNGYFTIPSDGYVFVTGGNATDTYILMTWSDWTIGPDGSFETYTEDVINLSAIMTNYFPYGLCMVGGIADEIGLSAGYAISRITRMAYTAENLAAAKASGRAYEADTDYIYIVKETADAYAISVGGSYDAYDHGLEIIDGSSVAPFTQTLYGQNLKDKLRTDVLTKSAQALTDGQKSQARTNIGAASAADLTSLFNKIANVINPGGLSNNERYLAGNLGTVSAANVADFVSSYGLSTGNFKDIYPGCFIQIPDSVANTTWMVGGLGIKHNSGDTAMGHGAEFIPRGAGFAFGTQMNPTNTTEGGYKGSAMKTYLDGTLTPALQAVLGNHLLKQRVLITNAVDTTKVAQYSGLNGMASGCEWADAYAVLMSEVEVYGSMIWGGPYDVGEARTKLPVFNFISPVEFGRGAFWLRAIASSLHFAYCAGSGGATYGGASSAWLYVRPIIRIG